MLKDLLTIARPDHWFKNVFMAPGLVLGWLACPPADAATGVLRAAVGVAATCLACSANYTLNELLDAPSDRAHPEKRFRPVAAGRVGAAAASAQWLVLAAAALGASWLVGRAFLAAQAALLAMGVLYNARPVRLKDRPYLDVLSESLNNPLRLLLGWYAIGCTLVPPASLLLAYWMLGAYLMAAKRFAELGHLGDRAAAAAYRRSFAHYTRDRLLVSIVFYAAAAALFAGVFLIRYQVELVLAVPFVAGFLAMYMRLALLPDSPAMYPEKLYRYRSFTAFACLTAAVLIACLLVRLPWLDKLFTATVPTQTTAQSQPSRP